MTIIVQGTRITLTTRQIAAIEKERKSRERCRNSFKKMLTRLGFKENTELQGSFIHSSMPWYAEIIDRGHYSDVWMVGEGLKDSQFPGGWVYESPIEIEKEILKSLEAL